MQIIKPKPRYKINYKVVADHLGVKLRGNETFDELLKRTPIFSELMHKLKSIGGKNERR